MSWWIWSGETDCLWTAHLPKSICFAPTEANVAPMNALSDFVLENRMGRLSCVFSSCLPAFLTVCLFSLHLCTSIESTVCDVWLPFLLNNYTIHLRASGRTLVHRLWVGHLSALVRHCRRSNVQAEAFYYAGEAPTPRRLPVVSQQRQVAFKEVEFCCGLCVRACVHACVWAQGWWSIKWFWQWMWCSIYNESGTVSFID